MDITFIKTWGGYRKGTKIKSKFLGMCPCARDSWNFENEENSEQLIGVPGYAFTVENIDFDPTAMKALIETNNVLSFSWEQTNKTDKSLKTLFKNLVADDSHLQRTYLRNLALTKNE